MIQECFLVRSNSLTNDSRTRLTNPTNQHPPRFVYVFVFEVPVRPRWLIRALADNSLENRCLDDPKSALAGPITPDKGNKTVCLTGWPNTQAYDFFFGEVVELVRLMTVTGLGGVGQYPKL